MNIPEMWARYRLDMASHAGVAIFIFGNKIVDGTVVFSDGVRKEFEIAKEKDLFLIPVGVTGYMAKELWNEIKPTFEGDTYSKYISSRLLLLGDQTQTPTQIIEAITEIIQKISN